jgi:mono/diheme cytochrome c family protein
MHFRTLIGVSIAASTLAAAMPATADDPATVSGSVLYQRLCASCHGREGHGDGPVGPSLKTAVPDLTRLAQRHDGHFPENWVYRVIDGREAMLVHGPREMPVWGYELWREQGADVNAGAKARELIDRIVGYLKDLQVSSVPTDRGRAPQ